jgi:hypothetical protein
MTSIYCIPKEETQFIIDELQKQFCQWCYLVVVNEGVFSEPSNTGVSLNMSKKFLGNKFEENVKSIIKEIPKYCRIFDTREEAETWGQVTADKLTSESFALEIRYYYKISALPKGEK